MRIKIQFFILISATVLIKKSIASKIVPLKADVSSSETENNDFRNITVRVNHTTLFCSSQPDDIFSSETDNINIRKITVLVTHELTLFCSSQTVNVSSSSETENINIRNITVPVDHDITLVCSSQNSSKQRTWLKNNKPLQDSKNMEILENGRLLKMINITLNSEGNYTCTCEDADCQPITYYLFVHVETEEEVLKNERVVHVETEEERIQRIEKTFQDMKHFLAEAVGYVNEDFGISVPDDLLNQFQFERQDFKKDVQKIFVNNGKLLVLSCIDQYDTLKLSDSKYAWLKDNKPLESSDPKSNVPLFIGPVTKKHSGKYTCKCKDNSCVPNMHTYLVKVEDASNP